jgi:hypothetical protein
VENVAARVGGVDVLFAAYEQLQVPIAQMREKFGIGGMRAEAARNFRDKARMNWIPAHRLGGQEKRR